MRRALDWLFVTLCAATLAVVVFAIARGPGDLYEKDQPKTIAYTADVVLHGRWALPRDVIYQPATKPPLYNWIDAGVVWATGSWSETVLKAPSILGAIGICATLLVSWHGHLGHVDSESTARRTADHHERDARATKWVGVLAVAMFAAFGVDVRHGSTMRLAYLARPDMLQVFFVTLAWVAATRAFTPTAVRSDFDDREVDPTAQRSAWVEATLFWTGAIGAILTKGPLALLLFIYAPIAARVIAGQWSAIRVIRPLVGFAATVVLVSAWLACAYHADAAHVRHVMLGAEVIDRIASETPEGLSKPFYFAAMWFVTKGGPIAAISLIACVTSIAIAVSPLTKRRTRRGFDVVRAERDPLYESSSPPERISARAATLLIPPAIVAAAIWLIVLLVGLSLPAGKRIDYLLPTYAPASLLAAWFCVEVCRRLRVPIAIAALLPLALSIQLAHARLTKFGETRERWTDHTVAFVDRVRTTIGSDSLVVIVRGKHPIPTLLGRHYGSALTVEDLRAARWAILDVGATPATPTLASAPIPHGFDDIDHRELAPVGLYDLSAADAPSIDVLVREQQNVGRWTTAENPYRSPRTVWRE